MRYRAVFAIVVVALTAAFFIVNWSVFTSAVRISLVVTSVEAPIGAVMLGLLALVILALAVYVGIWQSTFLIEFKRQSKELQLQRSLADNAEASRFTALGALLRSELLALEARLDASLAGLRAEFRDTEGSIAATLGEMDDRMRRNIVPDRDNLKLTR